MARTLLSRIWHAIPDLVFRLLGAAVFSAYTALAVRSYILHWPRLGYWYAFDDGRIVHLPFVQMLVDLSLLTVAIGYLVRVPPLRRAAGFDEVVLPLFAAFFPMYPFLIAAVLAWANDHQWMVDWVAPAAARMHGLLAVGRMSFNEFAFGCGLIAIGNALDIWSYLTLRRSLSIVAEARELKVGGPYRLIRHPIYLGQFIAQAGVWLVLRRQVFLWLGYYLTFVLLQLYRSWVEERVLERAFGDEFRRWRKRSIWFF